MEQLEEVEVRADYDPEVTGPFLPEVEGTRINAGRKTSNIVLKELPEISNDNFRQVLATTPGVILAEESTPLLSIGYRGYDPHRTQYFQVLEDGIPIHADMFRNNATESQYQLECWSASRGRLRGASRTVKRATTLLRYAWTHTGTNRLWTRCAAMRGAPTTKQYNRGLSI